MKGREKQMVVYRKHKHKPITEKTVCFSGCCNSNKCDPRSHGCVTHIDVCACGAEKYTNVNQDCSETSGWYDPEPSEHTWDYKDKTNVVRQAGQGKMK